MTLVNDLVRYISIFDIVRETDGDVNLVSYKMFCQKQETNEKLPPTQESLIQRTKRVKYQTYI